MNANETLAPISPRRRRSFALPLALSLLVASPFAAPAHAGERSGARSGAKSAIDLSLPLSFLGAMGGNMTISCDTDADHDLRAAMRALDSRGGSGRYAWTDDDGSRMVARRNGGRFRLNVTDDDDKTVVMEMPWGVAQCLFSGSKSGPRRMSVASLQRDGGFTLKVDGENASLNVKMK